MVIGLYVVGVLSLLVGGYGIYSGIMMDTAVETGEGLAAVANLQLMHVQSANLILGCAFWIIAAITLSSGAIIEAIRARRGNND